MIPLVSRAAASLALALALTAGASMCSAPTTTAPARSSTCDPGWVCTPGTDRCDPDYVCGTCPDTKDYKGESWSYLNDGSELAREAQTDPKLIPIIDPRRPCG